MSEYERTMVIEAKVDDVFEFVSDLNNLPDYLPTVQRVTPQSGDRIRVEGEAGGKKYDDKGYFRVDAEARRLEWGSDGDRNYSGWMQVEEGVEEVFSTRVSVHISYETSTEMIRQLEKQGKTADEVMTEGIDNTLRSIKNLCEGRGDKVESQATS